MPAQKRLNVSQRNELLEILQVRFEGNTHRHDGVAWSDVAARLDNSDKALWSLHEMERTGGEPDVVSFGGGSAITFCDCATQSPAGRRSLCYDRAALEARKKHKPDGNAVDAAAAMGIELLTEDQYRQLQALEAFDTKTSSWVSTPDAVRALGGAIFCDRRYDRVFTYHNGAESYYAARGLRGVLEV